MIASQRYFSEDRSSIETSMRVIKRSGAHIIVPVLSVSQDVVSRPARGHPGLPPACAWGRGAWLDARPGVMARCRAAMMTAGRSRGQISVVETAVAEGIGGKGFVWVAPHMDELSPEATVALSPDPLRTWQMLSGWIQVPLDPLAQLHSGSGLDERAIRGHTWL